MKINVRVVEEVSEAIVLYNLYSGGSEIIFY